MTDSFHKLIIGTNVGSDQKLAIEAQAGDPVGKKIIGRGARHLFRCLSALQFNAGDPLCLTGGGRPHDTGYLPDGVTAGLIQRQGNALDGCFRIARARVEKRQEGTS